MNQISPAVPKDAEITALRTIVAGTARSTGEAFFQTLVRHLAEALNVQHAFVAEFVERPARVRSLAWRVDFLHYFVPGPPGSPTEELLSGGIEIPAY